MGSVLRSFGAFQGNIWSVAPFIPVGPGENQCCPHKTRIFSKSPNGPIFKFFLVVQNIVFDIIHSKIRPNNFFPYIRILTRCAERAAVRMGTAQPEVTSLLLLLVGLAKVAAAMANGGTLQGVEVFVFFYWP